MKKVNIQIESTNNRTIAKFISNTKIIENGSYEYNNVDDAGNSLLVQQLFYLPFVKKVFITANFIAIQRYDIVEWVDVQNQVKEQIENYINTGNSVVKENHSKKEAIEVYAEITPNPSVMKFGTNKALTQVDFELKNIEEAGKYSPFAQALFNFPFVKEVFISENYVSVTKFDVVPEWNEVYQEIRSFIRTYLQDKKTVISGIPEEQTKENIKISTEDLDETSIKIIEILNEYIKPAVASDGGNITFQNYNSETKKVSVVLQGACSGCPSSAITLKNGIETMLKEMLPNQINEVIAING